MLFLKLVLIKGQKKESQKVQGNREESKGSKNPLQNKGSTKKTHPNRFVRQKERANSYKGNIYKGGVIMR